MMGPVLAGGPPAPPQGGWVLKENYDGSGKANR
jgi:hypothetical protein